MKPAERDEVLMQVRADVAYIRGRIEGIPERVSSLEVFRGRLKGGMAAVAGLIAVIGPVFAIFVR